MIYCLNNLYKIPIGRSGENLARMVSIDIRPYMDKWPSGRIQLLIQRPGEGSMYPAQINVHDGVLHWTVTDADTAIAGTGHIEIRITDGDVLAKSMPGSFVVGESMSGTETDPPDPVQGWVDQVLVAGSNAQASAEEAGDAANRAERAAETLSGIGAKAITTAPGTDAKVEVKDGVITYSIPRGDTGPQGPQGEQGIQGVQGDPGYTPVRGVDYWTAADQEAIDAAREGEERRSAAEDARAQAERDRAAAEQSRVAAEEQRQTSWQTLRRDVEQRISDAEIAAQNANKAETAANSAAEKADAAAQRADDAVSGMEDRFTASEKALLDKVCPPFEQSGSVVQCYPVEGYPLDVVTRIDALQHFDWVHRIAETVQGEDAPSPEYPQALTDSIPAGSYYVPSSNPEGGFWKIQLDEALGGVPQYADAIEVDRYTGKYRIIRRTGRIVLDGSDDERWSIGGKFLEDQSDWYYTIPVAGSADVSDGRVMCSHYPYNVIINNGTAHGASILWSCLRIRWGSEQPIDTFRAQLAASPITVRYQLQTESVIIGQAERVKDVRGLTALNAADMALTQPDPDHPCAITGWENVELVRCGKNLLNRSELEKYENWRTDIAASGTHPTESGNRGYLLNLDPEREYTISLNGERTFPTYLDLCYAVNGIGYLKAYLTTDTVMNETLSFRPQHGEIWYLRMGSTGNAEEFTRQIGLLKDLQLELGSSATDYEPYQGSIFTTALPEPIYGGTLNWSTGELTVNYGRYVATHVSALAAVYDGVVAGSVVMPARAVTAASGMATSDWLQEVVSYAADRESFYTNQTMLYIKLDKKRLAEASAEGMTAFLAEHPLTVVYKLETPVVTRLTAQQVMSISGINTLYGSSGDTTVAGRMSPIYLTQSILDRLAALEGAAIAE